MMCTAYLKKQHPTSLLIGKCTTAFHYDFRKSPIFTASFTRMKYYCIILGTNQKIYLLHRPLLLLPGENTNSFFNDIITKIFLLHHSPTLLGGENTFIFLYSTSKKFTPPSSAYFIPGNYYFILSSISKKKLAPTSVTSFNRHALSSLWALHLLYNLSTILHFLLHWIIWYFYQYYPHFSPHDHLRAHKKYLNHATSVPCLGYLNSASTLGFIWYFSNPDIIVLP
jgi:hypothetical protein